MKLCPAQRKRFIYSIKHFIVSLIELKFFRNVDNCRNTPAKTNQMKFLQNRITHYAKKKGS